MTSISGKGGPHLATERFVIDRAANAARDDFRDHRSARFHWPNHAVRRPDDCGGQLSRGSAVRDDFGLLEETIELPEAVLLVLAERMVVALRTLHLHAEEEPRGQRGRGDRVLVEVREQKIRCRILFRRPLRRNQRVDDFIPGDARREAVTEEFLEFLPVDARRAGLAADQEICPESRPVARVAGIPQEPLDHGHPLPTSGLIEERVEILFGWDVAHDVEINAADPFLIGRDRGGLHARSLPAARQPRVNEGNRVDGSTRPVGFGTRRGRGFQRRRLGPHRAAFCFQGKQSRFRARGGIFGNGQPETGRTTVGGNTPRPGGSGARFRSSRVFGFGRPVWRTRSRAL